MEVLSWLLGGLDCQGSVFSLVVNTLRVTQRIDYCSQSPWTHEGQ